MPPKTRTRKGKNTNVIQKEDDNKERPRRDRRLPNRFVENHVLKNLSNSKENESISSCNNAEKKRTPVKSAIKSPFKTPPSAASTKTSFAGRPTRGSRLPSRFDDHSVSPIKFIPVQPVHSSTPIVQNNVKKLQSSPNIVARKPKKAILHSTSENKDAKVQTSNRNQIVLSPKKCVDTQNENEKKSVANAKKKTESKEKSVSPDTNNNPKNVPRSLRSRKPNLQMKDVSLTDQSLNVSSDISFQVSPPKVSKPNSVSSTVKYTNKQGTKQNTVSSTVKNINKNETNALKRHLSFKILGSKKQVDKETNKDDVYEFTFDPNEEPPPQKKKKKRNITKNVKKPVKPKTVVLKNNYERNISKAMSALKNTIVKNTPQNTDDKPQNVAGVSATQDTQPNYNSVRIEDIAADFQSSPVHNDINYSPVTSPHRPKTPTATAEVNKNDPLNLRDDFSFFDDHPVASSSMNVSTRHPQASPWRVEFGNLPIKWHVSSYVKPNMTPAFECSFVNFNNTNKKHVYTNLVAQSNEILPAIVEKEPPPLKQTSIISFIKEIVEKSANKKRGKSATPVGVFDDITNKMSAKTNSAINKTPRQVLTPQKSAEKSKHAADNSNESYVSNVEEIDKENSNENRKLRTKPNDSNEVPRKTLRKDKDNTYFGFDDTDDFDQENISQNKVDSENIRALRPRSKAVLKERNEQAGPTRAMLAMKPKPNSEILSKLVPVVQDENPADNVETTSTDEITNNQELVEDDDAESVHLFEDIELIHHLKPLRKSYGKTKKVQFRQNSSDSESQTVDLPRVEPAGLSDENDLDDLTFEVPTVHEKKTKKKKPNKKQMMTKKEAKEAEEWAAGFNSMCEDIEEFALVVE